MSTQAFAHYLQLRGTSTQSFQNYWINENVTFNGITYSFLPFGFSGVTVPALATTNQPRWCFLITTFHAAGSKLPSLING
jgi:hypothetical protein